MVSASALVLVLAVSVVAAAGSPLCFKELKEETPTFTAPTGSFAWSDFNVISFGSIVANTGDIEGRAAAAGDVTFGSGFSVGDQIDTGSRPPVDQACPDSLVVGGDLTWGSGALFPDGSGNPFPGAAEGLFVASTIKAPAYLVERRDGSACSQCLGSSFREAQVYYTEVGASLAKSPNNVAASLEYGSGMFLTGVSAGTSSTRYHVEIPASTFNSISWWSATHINIESEFIVTITGTEDVTFSGGQFPGLPERVVFNIPGSRVVTVSTEVVGSILAPQSTVHQTGGVIKGFLVASDITALLQVNKPVCGGCDCCGLCDAGPSIFPEAVMA